MNKPGLWLLITYIIFGGYALIEAESYLEDVDVGIFALFAVGAAFVVVVFWVWQKGKEE